MPRGDRTGPEGAGPMTGRALGYCGGFGSAGYTRFFPGRSVGRGGGRRRGGAGFGRGRRFGFRGGGWGDWGPWPAARAGAPAADPEAERESLSSRVEALRAEIEAIAERLKRTGDETE